jgi:hypothetical protein
MGAGGYSPRVKRPGREADHSPPTSTEVKRTRIYTSTCYTSSWRSAKLVKHRDNFTFDFYLYLYVYKIRNVCLKRNMISSYCCYRCVYRCGLKSYIAFIVPGILEAVNIAWNIVPRTSCVVIYGHLPTRILSKNIGGLFLCEDKSLPWIQSRITRPRAIRTTKIVIFTASVACVKLRYYFVPNNCTATTLWQNNLILLHQESVTNACWKYDYLMYANSIYSFRYDYTAYVFRRHFRRS